MKRRHAALGLLALPLAGCGLLDGDANRVDAEWHKRALLEGHLAHWLRASPLPSGFFQTALDRSWKPKPGQPGDLTRQCRLVYAMFIGHELTGDARYLEAARRGADFVLTRYRDKEHGGYFLRVSPEGKVLAEHKNTYAHAFVLFALAHAFRVTKEQRYAEAAFTTWKDIDRGLRDPAGGFRSEASRGFTAGAADTNTQNHVMHLFEALLAWAGATGHQAAQAGAANVGSFVLYRLLQGRPDGSACIPEWYDGAWKPLASKDKGAHIDLGHQFEWAHLLLGAERAGLSGMYPQAAQRVLAYALKEGYDDIDGGCLGRSFPDGTKDRSKGWWQQAECLRALLAAAAPDGAKDLWRRYEQTLELVRTQFADPQGGWFAGPRNRCSGGCGDEQPDPYHMTGMHLAAIRWREERRA